MRTLLPVLLALAFAAGAWLFLGPSATETEPLDDLGGRATGDGGPARIDPGPDAPSLEGTGPDPAVTGRPPSYPLVAPDEFPRGGLDVRPLQPDGTLWRPDAISVRLERVPRPFWAAPGGRADYDTRVWHFRRVPVGRVRVIVTGDHVVEAVGEAEIRAGTVETVEVVASAGGAITFTARRVREDEGVDQVTLTLLDAETDQAVPAAFQERAPAVLGEVIEGTEATLGPRGVIFGVPPGRYRLRGTSAGDEVHEVEVVVQAGRTAEAALEFLR
jgi:hypothetical protein